MLLKYFYDKQLAHASYLVGCHKSGEALVIDPGRDVKPYLEAAAAEGMRIVGAAETHIHADFVSGSRELADRVGAVLYLSDEGPADWKYQFTDRHDVRLVRHGDEFRVGNVKLEVVHTPGHTPEHISFLLTDEGGGATAPLGIFTGDFVFVGSIGRPDLLETAAGVVGSAEKGARQLFHSMRKFRELPDHLQVWPAHGAGSACGKGLGAIPSTTVGYEKRFNPALQYDDEQAFVDYILANQPETPFYFAVMKRVNKEGPALLRELPAVNRQTPQQVTGVARQHLVIDTAPGSEFAAGHVPATLNVPAASLVQWSGFLVDYTQPLYLLTPAAELAANLRGLRSIGIDDIAGYFDAEQVRELRLRTEAYGMETPAELREAITSGSLQLLDVRAATEFNAEHIEGAKHRFLGTLPRSLDRLACDRPVVVQCKAGGRSPIAASLLQRAGFNVLDMQGGLDAWKRAGLPVVQALTVAAV